MSLAGVIVNRVLPELFGTREGQAFEGICREPTREFLAAKIGGRPEPLLDAARGLMVKMRRSRAAHLERLRESVSAGTPGEAAVPLLYVPVPLPALLRAALHSPDRGRPGHGAKS